MDEEPVKPKGHERKPKPTSFSLFKWALSLEQETGLILQRTLDCHAT